ncbi:hypothetical protein [uncultured Parolsenella sp.]|uniref:hypothetical protein n=1 Tax=uncultured Parolsenella sp. TaxID=2083008 RepID=UPI0027DC1C9E|nr:hypothetical protein [uncultured Parolsenella sp.]
MAALLGEWPLLDIERVTPARSQSPSHDRVLERARRERRRGEAPHLQATTRPS